MKRLYANVWAAFGLMICLLTGNAKAQSYYWDINGATAGAGGATPSGVWEDANWTTDNTGASATINLPESQFPRFSTAADATGNYTVTVNQDHTIIGMLHNSNNNPALNGTVTITGPGVLTISPVGGGGLAGIQQGFFGGTNGFIRIQSKLTGAGGIISTGGQIYLDGDNDYSGGTTPGTGLINFNNAHSFGTGNIILSATLGAIIAEGSAAINIPNNITVSLATVSINFVGNTAGITYSGNINLGANTLNLGCGGSTANIDILSGVISGSGSFGRQTTQSPAGIIKLTGANTYTGKTTLSTGSTWASSLNSVVGGTASSSLGAPTTVANGTIALGSTTFSGTLVYTGVGETTDRVIDLAGTTGNATIQTDGSGPLVFTSDFTATGAGAKTLNLRGSNTGNNTIAGKIVNGSVATSVNKLDAGTWTLSGASSYSGTTTLTAGRLNIGNASALGISSFVVAGNGSFDNTSGADISIVNSLTCSGGSPTYAGSANNLTFLGPASITVANRTITVTAHTLTLSLGLNDDGLARNFTKAGAGTLVLGAASTYTGTTTISGGRLQVGTSDALFLTPSLTLNGGTFDPGGFSQNLGNTTFGLTGGTSAIDFGTFPVELDFAFSASASWTGSILNLVNWDAGQDALRFGQDNGALMPDQLAKIEFNGAGLGTAQLDSNGYIFAVPEPSTFALEFAGALGVMVMLRRRLA